MELAIQELVPRKIRLVLYVLSALALMALAAWQGSEGEWTAAIIAFLNSLAPILAAANLNPPLELYELPCPDEEEPVYWDTGEPLEVPKVKYSPKHSDIGAESGDTE